MDSIVFCVIYLGEDEIVYFYKRLGGAEMGVPFLSFSFRIFFELWQNYEKAREGLTLYLDGGLANVYIKLIIRWLQVEIGRV